MPIRNGKPIPFPTFFRGIDNSSEVDSSDTEGTLSVALNTDLVEDSLVAKRKGYGAVNSSAWNSCKIRAGIEYATTGGTREILLYGQDSTPTGNSGRFGKLSAALDSVSDISTGLLDNVKPTLLQFRNLVFCFNGQNDFLYNGTSTRQIGITPPTVAPTFSVNSLGSLNASASYLFAYTYYNSVTGAESTPSDPSEIMSSGSTDETRGITINIAAGDATTADTIKVYRTVAGGDTFYLDGEVSITTTSYGSNVADSGLSTELELDNSRPIGAAKYAVVVDNRIMLAGFPTNPNRVHYSKVGINGPMPESFQADDFADCNINDGDAICNLGSVNNTTIIIKQKSVGRLVRVDALVGGLERSGSAKYIYEEISNQTTGLENSGTITLDNILIWVGKDDIYGTDGVQIFRFGRRIRKTLVTLNNSYAYKWSAINKTGNQQLIFSVTSAGKTEPDFQLVGHYKYFKKTGEIGFTFYAPGTNTTTHPGIRAASLFEVTESGSKAYYFGNSNGDGKVYRMDYGNNDASLGIYWDVRLPWFSAGNGVTKKTFHSYYMLAAGQAGASYSVTHTFEKDRSETIVKTASSSLAFTGTTNWGEGDWGSFDWGGISYVPVRFFPGKKAYFGRYGFSNTNADQPVVVHGIQAVVQPENLH